MPPARWRDPAPPRLHRSRTATEVFRPGRARETHPRFPRASNLIAAVEHVLNTGILLAELRPPGPKG